MTQQKKEALRDYIFKLLLDDGVAVYDERAGCKSPDQIVELFDRLLYEQAGKEKTVPYEAMKTIYKDWNHHYPPLCTIKEMSEEHGLPMATVYKITQGEFWPM